MCAFWLSRGFHFSEVSIGRAKPRVEWGGWKSGRPSRVRSWPVAPAPSSPPPLPRTQHWAPAGQLCFPRKWENEAQWLLTLKFKTVGSFCAHRIEKKMLVKYYTQKKCHLLFTVPHMLRRKPAETPVGLHRSVHLSVLLKVRVRGVLSSCRPKLSWSEQREAFQRASCFHTEPWRALGEVFIKPYSALLLRLHKAITILGQSFREFLLYWTSLSHSTNAFRYVT